MSILKVIKRVIMVCEEYNKPVDDIDVVDGLLLVSLKNGLQDLEKARDYLDRLIEREFNNVEKITK